MTEYDSSIMKKCYKLIVHLIVTHVFIRCVLYTVYLQYTIPAICPLSLSVSVVHTGDVSKITVTPLAVQDALQFVP